MHWCEVANAQLESGLGGPVCQQHWGPKALKMTVKEGSVELEQVETAQIFNQCGHCLMEAASTP